MSVSLIDGHIDDDVPMKNNELKNCPFCGGEAKMCNDILNEVVFVYCKHCNASTMIFNNKEVATEAWNRRVDNG